MLSIERKMNNYLHNRDVRVIESYNRYNQWRFTQLEQKWHRRGNNGGSF